MCCLKLEPHTHAVMLSSLFPVVQAVELQKAQAEARKTPGVLQFLASFLTFGVIPLLQ